MPLPPAAHLPISRVWRISSKNEEDMKYLKQVLEDVPAADIDVSTWLEQYWRDQYDNELKTDLITSGASATDVYIENVLDITTRVKKWSNPQSQRGPDSQDRRTPERSKTSPVSLQGLHA
ncbi:hypothetical protein KCU65_g6394, partial [Aureobasidium melanogenum]